MTTGGVSSANMAGGGGPEGESVGPGVTTSKSHQLLEWWGSSHRCLLQMNPSSTALSGCLLNFQIHYYSCWSQSIFGTISPITTCHHCRFTTQRTTAIKAFINAKLISPLAELRQNGSIVWVILSRRCSTGDRFHFLCFK